MARETKAQRLAREEAERNMMLEQEKEEYFPKLMSLLERANKLSFTMSVSDGKFNIEDLNDRDTYFSFPYSWSPEFDSWEFDRLEMECDRKERAIYEENRKGMLKAQGLSKLSIEEREALGL